MKQSRWALVAMVLWEMVMGCTGQSGGIVQAQHAQPSEPTGFVAESNRRIEQLRKGDFTLTVLDEHGQPLRDAQIDVELLRHQFLFGTAIADGPALSDNVQTRERYRQFIVEHFNAVVCENAMKWYHIGKQPGVRQYEQADALLAFADDHYLTMRGHCVVWGRDKYVQEWVKRLSKEDLSSTLRSHVEEVVARYQGRVICWDVNNEMLDGDYFRRHLGPDADAAIFRQAHEQDANALLFVNEYGILSSERKTARYIDLIRGLQARGAVVGGIGVQEHAAERFDLHPPSAGRRGAGPATQPASQSQPATQRSERPATQPVGDDGESLPERQNADNPTIDNAMEMLDKLAELGLPIHLTEISSRSRDPQRRADGIEAMLRLGFSHPKVEAVMLWGFWEKAHWMGADAALVDRDWKLTEAGERYVHLMSQWRTVVQGRTNAAGQFGLRGFFGTYRVRVNGRSAECVFSAGEPHVTIVLTPPSGPQP